MQYEEITRDNQDWTYITQGWRGAISTCTIENITYAKKQAISKEYIPNIQREIQVLQKIKSLGLSGYTNLLYAADEYFVYPRVEGAHFIDTWQDTKYSKSQLLSGLIKGAVTLDEHKILHDELHRPRTNVLVDTASNITIIDFDQGSILNTNNKNLRHLMQRLHQEGYIPVTILPTSRYWSREELYSYLISIAQSV